MSNQSTPFKPVLTAAILKALTSPNSGTVPLDSEFKASSASATSIAQQMSLQQAQAISDAVELYVNARLEALALQLKLPSAFIGASAAGPVTIAPASFAAYDPKTT